MGELYSFDPKQRCPGESACQRFESAAGDTREEKLHACQMCPLLPTKPSPTTRQADEVVDRIERLARERDSGWLQIETLKPWEWELLLIWDEAHATLQRSQQAEINALLQALLQRPM